MIISAEVAGNKMYTKNIASMMDEHSAHKNPAQSTEERMSLKLTFFFHPNTEAEEYKTTFIFFFILYIYSFYP